MAVGDSGAWVFDKLRGEVYGYVTCSDAFGDAIVMPMRSALADIESRLSAVRVRLLLEAEVSTAENLIKRLTLELRLAGAGYKTHSLISPGSTVKIYEPNIAAIYEPNIAAVPLDNAAVPLGLSFLLGLPLVAASVWSIITRRG